MWQVVKTWVSGKPRIKEVKQKIKSEYDKVHPVPVGDRRPWYAKHGLKRALGVALGSAGGALLLAGNVLWGAVAVGVGGFIEVVGVVDGSKKAAKNTDQTDNVTTAIMAWLKASYNLIKCILQNKKKGK